MSRNNETRSNSELYTRIKALPLTSAERTVAIHALREGEMIADMILAVFNGIKRLATGTTLKTSLKH